MNRLTPAALRARLRAAIGEPDVTRQGFDLASARARRRRWWALGPDSAPSPVRPASMVVVVMAVAAVVTAGTLINLRALPKPAGSSNGPAGVSQTSPAPSPASTPVPVPLGPPVDGFVPEDVTAVSAAEWWVLGSDSTGCSGAACVRILHTLDAGQSFTSIPTPPASVSGLRFADPEDGWAYSPTAVWSTHDGGAEWTAVTFAGMSIEDLEASGGHVYAVVCHPGPGCTLERSPTNREGWQALPIAGDLPPSGYVAAGPLPSGYLAGSLNVHGSDVWMVFRWDQARGDVQTGPLVTSTDDGVEFTETSICPPAMAVTSVYAVSPDVLWAVCAGGSLQEDWRSTDGGVSFTMTQSGPKPSSGPGSIAGTSASSAVIAGNTLQLTTDGGRSFKLLYDNGDNWSVVGFTTSEDGFAFTTGGSSPESLWRTADGGAQWHEVQFP